MNLLEVIQPLGLIGLGLLAGFVLHRFLQSKIAAVATLIGPPTGFALCWAFC